MNDLKLTDLLQIENTDELISVRCFRTGIPIWTSIRNTFFRQIISDHFYKKNEWGGAEGSTVSSKFSRITLASRALQHNLFNNTFRESQILISASGSKFKSKNGLLFNCLADYFVAAVEDKTILIEEPPESFWPFPRYINKVILKTPYDLYGATSGRMREWQYIKSAQLVVDIVSSRAERLLGYSMNSTRKLQFNSLCARRSASFYPRYTYYQKLFKQYKTRLFIKEEAFYGGADSAAAILAAKNMGVITAEFQHGLISRGHDAYNFAPAIVESKEFKKIFPEHFLMYGSWWGNQFNAPTARHVIGNPHRSETLFNRNIVNNNILVLGDGVDTEHYLRFCKNLSTCLRGRFSVIFRPHPIERRKFSSDLIDSEFENVLIDKNIDMYQSFMDSKFVISEASTGLFEALGIVENIFVWTTPKSKFYFPDHPFREFNTVPEVASLILSNSFQEKTPSGVEKIWASNWLNNYMNFINYAGVI
jgi:hypothetical protein